MTTTLDWRDVALRLALTTIASGLIGFNRTEEGRPAGLRTTILVGIAAAAAMIQANYLLATHSRPPDSFIMADVLRFPLGVLSGMGFIGGGAILRRGSLVTGVTTAATLWFVTVMGLCFGGGQIGLGVAMMGVGLLVLWNLKWFEDSLQQDRRAFLLLLSGPGGPTETELRRELVAEGFRILSFAATYSSPSHLSELRCEVHYRGRPTDVESPPILRKLADRQGVSKVEWRV